MKKLLFLFFITLLSATSMLFANGVAIKNASTSEYFKLLSSDVQVNVYDQIAIVVTTQKFLNNTGEKTKIKYGFPLAEDANGIGLRWKLNGEWYSANISPSPQDTTLPGGGDENLDLLEFLGETPLFFPLEDSIANDSILTIELTYVQLLPYDFYVVDFKYPNNYSLIQSDIVEFQKINFNIESQRIITNLEMTSHTPDNIIFNDSIGEFDYIEYETAATTDYEAFYELSPEDLGLFSYSTLITDTAFNCDDYGNGFFTFIVEPDPSSEVIDKVFTLIIDRSGSMSGTKIVQARDAATYIVDNLNDGDYFNIVDFSTTVTSLFEDHIAFDLTSQNTAFDYIDNINAEGMTNISGAFETAIPDFASNDTTVANIIIFLTDGEATTGITSTDGILSVIQDLITTNEVNNLQIHTFGIGEYTNEYLLTQIAYQNNGLSEFLGDNELEEVITSFYRKIRNPVLINTSMEVTPPLLTEIYPSPLDNLYLGQQLIVVGRYDSAAPISVNFSGEAFGQPISYNYDVTLADTTIPNNQFLTKLWAKKKMDNLFILYHTYDENSNEAEEIKNEIIDISLCYNVMSPFTSYTGGGGGGGTTFIEYEDSNSQTDEQHSFASPNPVVNSTTINFTLNSAGDHDVTLTIFDGFGRVVYIAKEQINGKGKQSILWDGNDINGNPIPKGYYFYTIQFENTSLTGKIIKL